MLRNLNIIVSLTLASFSPISYYTALVGRKRLNKTFSYNSGCLAVIIRLCLTHMVLCDYDIEEKGLLLLCISKWLCRGSIEWKCQNFFVRHITVYAIKRRMDDGKGVNRRAGSSWKTFVDCASLLDTSWGTASVTVILKMVGVVMILNKCVLNTY